MILFLILFSIFIVIPSTQTLKHSSNQTIKQSSNHFSPFFCHGIVMVGSSTDLKAEKKALVEVFSLP